MHEQALVEVRVAVVVERARKVELCRQRLLTRRAHLDVHVTRAPRIRAGQDRLEVIATARVRELVAAQTSASVVVVPVRVGLPEVDPRTLDRPAARGQDEPLKREAGARKTCEHDVMPKRRSPVVDPADLAGSLRKAGAGTRG